MSIAPAIGLTFGGGGGKPTCAYATPVTTVRHATTNNSISLYITAFDFELATAYLLCRFFEGRAASTKKQISCTTTPWRCRSLRCDFLLVATLAESDASTVCAVLSTRNGKNWLPGRHCSRASRLNHSNCTARDQPCKRIDWIVFRSLPMRALSCFSCWPKQEQAVGVMPQRSHIHLQLPTCSG